MRKKKIMCSNYPKFLIQGSIWRQSGLEIMSWVGWHVIFPKISLRQQTFNQLHPVKPLICRKNIWYYWQKHTPAMMCIFFICFLFFFPAVIPFPTNEVASEGRNDLPFHLYIFRIPVHFFPLNCSSLSDASSNTMQHTHAETRKHTAAHVLLQVSHPCTSFLYFW